MHLRRVFARAALGLALAAGASCSREGVVRYSADQLSADLAPGRAEEVGVVLGEFPLKKGAVVDGDTIKVGGLSGSLRLSGLDTEETFKSEKAKRAFEVGWEEYLESEQAKTAKPVKIPTPLGEEAKVFAKHFFAGVTRVRLERDHPKKLRGRFNRFLVYVFVNRDGEWVNYNVEAVRAGMSPYFMKYGYSRRFHQDFVEAEKAAQEAQLGIWEPGTQHYRDYTIRGSWWRARAEFIKTFEEQAAEAAAAGATNWIDLSHFDALTELAALEGEEIFLLGNVGDVRPGNKGPARVMLGRKMGDDFPLIFFDESLIGRTGIDRFRGEFVVIRGVVSTYESKRTGRSQLQIEIKFPEQIVLPDYRPPGVDKDWFPMGKPLRELEGTVGGDAGDATSEPEPEPEPSVAPVDPDPATSPSETPPPPPGGGTI